MTQASVKHGIYTINRIVHTTKAHPQVGYIYIDRDKVLVYMGFYGDMPCWYTADDENDPQYLHCAKKTMPVSEDPEFEEVVQ